MSAEQTKDFPEQQATEQPTLEDAPFSALENSMMYFRETDKPREWKQEAMNSRVTSQMALRGAVYLFVVLAILTTSARLSRAQVPSGGTVQNNPPAEKAQGDRPDAQIQKDKTGAKQEVSVQDTGATFKVRVNMVQVRVVVRDSKGKPVESLDARRFSCVRPGKAAANHGV